MKAIALAVRSPHLPLVLPTQFPSSSAIVPAGVLCALPNGAGGQTGAGRRLCRQQHGGQELWRSLA